MEDLDRDVCLEAYLGTIPKVRSSRTVGMYLNPCHIHRSDDLVVQCRRCSVNVSRVSCRADARCVFERKRIEDDGLQVRSSIDN